MIILGPGFGSLRLQDFLAMATEGATIVLAPDTWQRIAQDHSTVLESARGNEPVYGLNTGLGANLNCRIPFDEIPGFQIRILRGRAVAVGSPLPEPVGRGVLLARILSASRGGSGISPALLGHIVAVYNAGLSPVIPETGSIGAGDLTQNAHFGLSILGEGELWRSGSRIDAGSALRDSGLCPPDLAAGDAMVLVNHSALTTVASGRAIDDFALCLAMARCSIVLSLEGFAANQSVFDPDVNALLPAPGQLQASDWFRRALDGADATPRRIQDPISFRGVAQVIGAGFYGLNHAEDVLAGALNGVSDSPVVTPDGRFLSTPNFQSPVLALALESLSLTLSMMATGAIQRMQRLMAPATSGLPRFLSPDGGASAGLVPLQKTAAALSSRIRHGAEPAIHDPSPVSENVEDMAPMTPLAAEKLSKQAESFKILAGLEALVAAQALDLRQPVGMGRLTGSLHRALRARIAALGADRSLARDSGAAATVIEAAARQVMRNDRADASGAVRDPVADSESTVGSVDFARHSSVAWTAT
ncbi:MAG: aromatic amino acid lyase [Paracoccaceae bacterium]|nr:aromatic amino acid lyase [Paracoccaceae bacterium]